jgi:hypothetical protein
MTVERFVDGPSWTGFGVEESAGRYPLRVEGAVSRIVDQLLPGVITKGLLRTMLVGIVQLSSSLSNRESEQPSHESA